MIVPANILDRIEMGIAVIGERGKVLFWNRWLQQRSAEASAGINGRTLPEIFGPRLEPDLLHSIERVLRHGLAMRLSHALHPAPFPLRPVAFSGQIGTEADDREIKQAVDLTPVWLDDGSRGCLVEVKDVTEAVRREQSLRQQAKMANSANQAKSRFLASVTHELRTPLHGILGYAELLSLEGGLSASQSQRLEVMMAAGQHLLAMVNSVLDMSQIEADQLELHPAAVELSGLVRVCLDVIRPAADAKGLALAHTATTPLQVVVDATRLRQVVLNLLGNAVKFTPQGRIEVRQQHAAGWFRLEVVDTGPGVRAMHRDKLFQTFERLNAEAVSGIEGTGLGLAINARLVQLMGGRIGYDDNPGGGSVFWLELPVGGAATMAPAKAAAPPLPGAALKMRLLVADDEALNRSIASEFLRSAGHEVVCVNDGAAAVEAATSADYDAILMDVRMPGMNGLEATRQIRNLPAPRGKVPIVAVTAQAFAQQIETCRQAGMDLHVPKPFKQAQLLAALEAAIGIRRGPSGPADPPGFTPLEAAPEPALFDQATFRGVASLLPAAKVARHLQNLLGKCEDLLPRLHALPPGDPDRALVEDAHRLAGSAGLLGFPAITAAASAFEVSAESGMPETPVLARELAAAIGTAMPIMNREVALISAGKAA